METDRPARVTLDTEKYIEDEGFYSHYSLLEVFSSEVLFEILSHLEWYELNVVAQTCTTFRDLVKSPALWQHISKLDFTKCVSQLPDNTAGPLAENVMAIVHKCPNAEMLHLADVNCSSVIFETLPPDGSLTSGAQGMVVDEPEDDNRHDNHDDDEDESDDERDNDDGEDPRRRRNIANNYDRLVLEILRNCPRLHEVDIAFSELSDQGVTAIAAKSSNLKSLRLCGSDRIDRVSVIDVVSHQRHLQSLTIENCRGVAQLNLKHSDPNLLLGLTHVSFIAMSFLQSNVGVLAKNCPNLVHLDLRDCVHLREITAEEINGSDTPQLQELILSNCHDLQNLELVDVTEVKVIDVAQCHNLAVVNLRCVSLDTIITLGCESLKGVIIHSGSLSVMEAQSLSSLNRLEIRSAKLRHLDISNCIKLSLDQLIVPNLEDIEELNISGCRQFSPDLVNSELLPKMMALAHLKYGGHSWKKATLKSARLRHFTFENTTNLESVVLQMPKLEDLRLVKCRDFTEMEMMDGILLGKWVKRFDGVFSKDYIQMYLTKGDDQHSENGTPNLKHLTLEFIQNLQGDIFSMRGVQLKHLTSLNLVSCIYLRHLELVKWSCLESLSVVSCSRLTRLKVVECDKINTVVVRWCGMVESMELECPLLDTLDMTGSSFGTFTVHSDKLLQLSVTGICMTPHNTADIRCPLLESVEFLKCDSLTNETIQDIMSSCPAVTSLTLTGCHKLSELYIPACTSVLRLTALRRLSTLTIHPDCKLRVLAVNNLRKITPTKRSAILGQSRDTLKHLEVRSIPHEAQLSLDLPWLTHLTLDQGIHLQSLTINCPLLVYLRVQGCPNLSSLDLHVSELPLLQVDHSSPLLALRTLNLSCFNVKFLGRVLGHYTPNLHQLVLKGDNTSLSRILSVGYMLPSLTAVTLLDCQPETDLEEYYPGEFVLTPVQLQRCNDVCLVVKFE